MGLALGRIRNGPIVAFPRKILQTTRPGDSSRKREKGEAEAEVGSEKNQRASLLGAGRKEGDRNGVLYAVPR